MSLPFKRSGGGFLNGVAGTIVGVNIDSKTWDPKKKGGDPYTTFSVELNIKQDGADEPVSQFLQGGFLYDEHSISDDGQEIIGGDDSVVMNDSELGLFLQSAVEVGFPEEALVESNLRRFDALVNQRFVFKRTEDNPHKKPKAKDGREYKERYLQVSEYLGEATSKPAAKKVAGKSAPATKSAGKPNGKAANAEADAQIARTREVLLDILGSEEGSIDRTKLSSKVVRYYAENGLDSAEREQVRKLIGSEDFLSQQDGWTYNAREKGQPVALA